MRAIPEPIPQWRSLRTRKTVNYNIDILPFPEGEPTEQVHHDILAWCNEGADYIDMGTVDNALVHLFIATKRRPFRKRSLVPPKCPEKYDIIARIPNKLVMYFARIITETENCMREDWETIYDHYRIAWTPYIEDIDLLEVTLSPLFRRCVYNQPSYINLISL
jgi:hypothetical protein